MTKSSKKHPAKKATKPAPKKGKAVEQTPVKDVPPPAPRPPAPRERDPRLPAVGSTITKDWKGKKVKVLCVADGFETGGKSYGSLSSAAKAVSGYPSVNGFLFFGLIPGARPTPAATPTGRKAKKATESKIGGDSNEIGTPAGQRAALVAAGLAKGDAPKTPAKKRGRPIRKPATRAPSQDTAVTVETAATPATESAGA